MPIKRDIRLNNYFISSSQKATSLVLSNSSGYIDDNYISKFDMLKSKFNITTITSNTTLTSNHFVVLINASSGSITITLPSASTNNEKTYILKRIDTSTNNVTVSPQSGQTIDGETSVSLDTAYQILGIVSNGSNWFIIYR